MSSGFLPTNKKHTDIISVFVFASCLSLKVLTVLTSFYRGLVIL